MKNIYGSKMHLYKKLILSIYFFINNQYIFFGYYEYYVLYVQDSKLTVYNMSSILNEKALFLWNSLQNPFWRPCRKEWSGQSPSFNLLGRFFFLLFSTLSISVCLSVGRYSVHTQDINNCIITHVRQQDLNLQ